MQLHAAFTLVQAIEVIDYLAELGIDWMYSSPLFMARPGSQHGYDVIDPTRVNPEIGSQAELERLAQTLHRHGMRLLLDIVPNHMAVHEANRFWLDVLEHGQESAYARFFDIDWQLGSGKVLLPFLGRDFESVLLDGEFRVEKGDGRHWLRYYDQRFPLRLPAHIPPASLTGSVTLELLRDLIAVQSYRLVLWSDPVPRNYRRFFEIDTLVGLRIEDPVVFETVHATVFDWVRRGWVNGLRIDHPDGLKDPVAYLTRLKRAALAALADTFPSSHSADASAPMYVVVEKILTGSESLRTSWPVHGTTGYEQANLIGNVLVDRANRAELLAAYAAFVGDDACFVEVARACKRLVLRQRFGVELARLASKMHELADHAQHWLDREELHKALLELIAFLPVYRTYVGQAADSLEAEDRSVLEHALWTAKESAPGIDSRAFDALASAFLLAPPLAADAESRSTCLEALLQFQQLTGPAAAKGVEDTALYRYVPLVSQNEVGGDPELLGITLEEFHAKNVERVRHWPAAISASSTHDTKRSEDVRARIMVLSEIPTAWALAARTFSALNERHKTFVAGQLAPSTNDEYLLYQTLLGSWPLESIARPGGEYAKRIQEYMQKAVREAKCHSSWLAVCEEYEIALAVFIEALFDEGRSPEFLQHFTSFQAPVAHAGLLTSLAQTVLKLGLPGVPDFYQGTELWDFSLVDPDNRRPVDFRLRRHLLRQVKSADVDVRALFHEMYDGKIKLHVINRALELRKRQALLFASGGYVPLDVVGERADQVVAFARVMGKQVALFASGRYFTRLLPGEVTGKAWLDTEVVLPSELLPSSYYSVLTGQSVICDSPRLRVAKLFEALPYAVLERVT